MSRRDIEEELRLVITLVAEEELLLLITAIGSGAEEDDDACNEEEDTISDEEIATGEEEDSAPEEDNTIDEEDRATEDEDIFSFEEEESLTDDEETFTAEEDAISGTEEEDNVTFITDEEETIEAEETIDEDDSARALLLVASASNSANKSRTSAKLAETNKQRGRVNKNRRIFEIYKKSHPKWDGFFAKHCEDLVFLNHPHFNSRFNVTENIYVHGINAELLNGLHKKDLVAVNLNTLKRNGFRNIGSRNGTIKAFPFNHATWQINSHLRELTRNTLSRSKFLLEQGFHGFTVAFDLNLSIFSSTQGQLAWEEIITGIAVLNLHDIHHLTEVRHIGFENNFHYLLLSADCLQRTAK